jgi:hypothetical protein
MFLFVHIPKTAGTSLRQRLSERLKDRIAFDYGPRHELTHELLRDPARSPSDRRASLEERGVEVLYGHVRYADWRAAFAPAEVVAVLRHPVDRCISHYQHYLTHGGDPADRMADRVTAGELGLREFARTHQQRNLQARCLGIDAATPESLAHYGTLLLSEVLDSTLGLRQRLNAGRRNFTVTPADIATIIEANPLDLLIYELVRQAGREGYWDWRIPDAMRSSSLRTWFGRC